MQQGLTRYRENENSPITLSLPAQIPVLFVYLQLAQKWKRRTSRSTQNSLKHSISMFQQGERQSSKVEHMRTTITHWNSQWMLYNSVKIHILKLA